MPFDAQKLDDEAAQILEEQLSDDVPDWSAAIKGMHGLLNCLIAARDTGRKKMGAMRKEHAEEAGLWDEQHRQQHAVNLRLEKELAAARKVIDAAFKLLKENDILRLQVEAAKKWLEASESWHVSVQQTLCLREDFRATLEGTCPIPK